MRGRGHDPRAAQPVCSATSGSSSPSIVPGATTSGRKWVGMPRRSKSGRAQSRVQGSRHWLVVASVYSATSLPQRKWLKRSGIISSRSACQDGVVRARLAEQLEDRVDGHELDACRGVELVARDDAEGSLEHALVARVAVVDGIGENRPRASMKP